MANWERRQADSLAEAIAKHRRNHAHQTLANGLLEAVQHAVDSAANTVTTTEAELQMLRNATCEICRQHALYPCDVPEGWSSQCALVQFNTSTHADL